jgi:hypothetical protein
MFFATSGNAVITVVAGGAGTLAGALYGSVLLALVKSVVGSWTEHHVMVIGLLFMAAVIFLPRGLLGLLRPRIERLMTRGARGRLIAPAKKLLDPSIFQRVERHNREAPPGFQQLLRSCKPAVKLTEFVVDRDPQCLTGPGGGIAAGLSFGYRSAHDLSEFRRAPNGPKLPCRRDCAGHSTGKAFLAEGADQFGELSLGQLG